MPEATSAAYKYLRNAPSFWPKIHSLPALVAATHEVLDQKRLGSGRRDRIVQSMFRIRVDEHAARLVTRRQTISEGGRNYERGPTVTDCVRCVQVQVRVRQIRPCHPQCRRDDGDAEDGRSRDAAT